MIKVPDSDTLIQIWERAKYKSTTEQALLLLAAACPDHDIDAISQWSIGQRDAHLFELRAQLFGTIFTNTVNCPNCQEKLEWDMQLSNFPIPKQLEVGTEKNWKVEIEGYSIQFRRPNSQDLLSESPEQILNRCISSITKEGQILEIEALPITALKTLGEKMEQVDPLANTTILLNCPACGHQWEVFFDIVRYLWAEIDNWVKHLLQEVFILAKAFHWSERDILNMSPQRRQLYLQMLRT